MPTSGSIGLRECITGIDCSSISCAVTGSLQSPASLTSLSVEAGKIDPHSMSDFYGYIPTQPLYLTTTSCSQTTDISYHCGRVDGMSTTYDCACVCVKYQLQNTAGKGTYACAALVCDGTTLFSCALALDTLSASGYWGDIMDYNDALCFVTETSCGSSLDVGIWSLNVCIYIVLLILLGIIAEVHPIMLKVILDCKIIDMETELNCLQCGMCCFLGKRNAGKKHCGIETDENGWCVFYKENKCSIYENRPQICKDVQVGGEFCLRMRRLLNKKERSKYE